MSKEKRTGDGPSSVQAPVAHHSPPTLQPEQRLAERYRIERCLGQGGMGEVYAVFDEQLREGVALKLMTLVGTEDASERFRSEVRLARRITHPNVARTHDLGFHQGQLFLTMERIDGISLDQRSFPLPPGEVTRVGTAVARGLAAAHEAGVVHRDLKPGNVLVSRTGRIAITDFGVARELLGAPRAKSSQVVGTPEYMAPEQILGLDISPATDVYALGILLYELLTGQLPFEGATAMAAGYARCQNAPLDPRTHVGELAPELCDLIMSCLARDPRQRPTASAVVAQLEAGSTVSIRHADDDPPRVLGSAGTIVAEPPTAGWTWGSGIAQVSRPLVPLEPGSKTLAVLPFAYRGPAEHDHLGESLSQELIDVLSRTRGLRILAFGATAAYGHARDARTVGSEIGAHAIVTGSIVASGEKMRISVRLVDVTTNEQIWTDRYEGDLGEVLSMEDVMSQRIAETLRVELTVAAHRARATPEAMSHYLRARRDLDQRQPEPCQRAVKMLELAIADSGDFAPALAAHAVACVRLWWFGLLSPHQALLREQAATSVARALKLAPNLAEAHLAAGMLALHQGDLKTTARELVEALTIAPTCAEAHRYLGELQCEAGRVDEGVRRLTLACELDPSITASHYVLARMAALRGDDAGVEHYLGILEKRYGRGLAAIVLSRVRVAGWKGDADALRTYAARLDNQSDPTAALVSLLAKTLLGEIELTSGLQMVDVMATSGNLRMAGLMQQLAVEVMALRGEPGLALEQLDKASASMLVDVEWLDSCPALATLRGHPQFAVMRDRVSDRIAAIWTI